MDELCNSAVIADGFYVPPYLNECPIFAPSDTYFFAMCGTMTNNAFSIPDGGVIDKEVYNSGTYGGRARAMICHSTSNRMKISGGGVNGWFVYAPITKSYIPSTFKNFAEGTTISSTSGKRYICAYFNYGGALPTFTGANVKSQFTINISGSSYAGAAVLQATSNSIVCSIDANWIELN